MTTSDEDADRAAQPARTVLVLEHDEAQRLRAVAMLHALGYQVLDCADGEAALGVLQSGARVDVIFAEVTTPGPVPALALSERALARDEEVEILFTSDCSDAFILDGGYFRQRVDLLLKPYDAQELDARIRHLLGNREQRRWLEAHLETPRRDTARVAAPAPPASGDEVLRVLLVEDSEDTLYATADLLEMLGYAVSPVSSAEAALALLRENTFDVLCSDVSLPGISGIELGRRVRDAHPSIGIIFASGYGARMGLESDALDAVVLPKPYGLDALENALRQVVASRAGT